MRGALDEAAMRQRSAKELVALGPDIILTQNTLPTASMLQETLTIPVVGSGSCRKFGAAGLQCHRFRGRSLRLHFVHCIRLLLTPGGHWTIVQLVLQSKVK